MSHCRLYLVSPPQIPDLSTFADDLDAVLRTSGAAAFQLRLKADRAPGAGAPNAADPKTVAAAAETLFPICRAHGVAAILNDDPAMAVELGADGAHVGQSDTPYTQARAMLGDDKIVGVTCHASRHAAMQAAEAGADYVAFGAFYPTTTKTPSARADLALLRWWAELFTTPCVAIGGISVDTAGELAQAGADFIAVSAGVWGRPDGPEAAGAAFARVLETP